MHKKSSLISNLAITLCIFIALVAGVYANMPITPSPQYDIAVIISDSTNQRWDNFKIGLRSLAAEKNIALNIIKTPMDMTDEEIIKHVKQQIETGIDGILLEPTTDEESLHKLATLMRKVPTVLLNTPLIINNTLYGSVSVDNYALGKTLALQLLRNIDGNTTKIGILNRHAKAYSNSQCLQGVKETLADHNLAISFILEDSAVNSDALKSHVESEGVDALIALDNDASEVAIDYQQSLFNPNLKLFIHGNSNKCIYYTDNASVTTMLAENSYDLGYHSLQQLYDHIANHEKLRFETIDYGIFTSANLFTTKNQRFLFPIRQ